MKPEVISLDLARTRRDEKRRTDAEIKNGYKGSLKKNKNGGAFTILSMRQMRLHAAKHNIENIFSYAAEFLETTDPELSDIRPIYNDLKKVVDEMTKSIENDSPPSIYELEFLRDLNNDIAKNRDSSMHDAPR